MAARSFDGCALTPAQSEALSAVGVVAISDTSCSAGDLNTCGRDATELLSLYPLYDPGKGIYTKWGNIPWSWDHEDALSDEQWDTSTYVDTYSYRTGDKILRAEDDGYKLVVYSAISDIPTPSGPFVPSLWSKVCQVVSSKPLGLPTISELKSKYPYYDTRLLSTKWGEFLSGWSSNLVNPNSDKWSEAVILKNVLYKKDDIVLFDSSCGDYTCVYVALKDVPANPEGVPAGPPISEYWQRQYCVENGQENKCEKKITCGPNRTLVDLGRENLICVPVESTIGVGPKR